MWKLEVNARFFHLHMILENPERSDRRRRRNAVHVANPAARGLHSFTFQLNVSAFCGIGGVLRGCLGGVSGY